MAVYPTDKSSPGTWGAECSAYHAVSTDLATGKIKDGAEQVSSAAPTVDAGVANKKYVDDSVGGDSPVTTDSESNTLFKSHAYQAQTSGFVNAYFDNTTETISGYVGSTTDPVGAGLKVDTSQINEADGNPSVSFFVAKGKYFEIVKVTGLPTIIWTPLAVGGGNPIDNN